MSDNEDATWWIRRTFRGDVVWARCRADGLLISKSGRVSFLYRLDGRKSYATFADRLLPVAGAEPEQGRAPIESPSGKSRRAASSKKSKQVDEKVIGGVLEDVTDPDRVHLWTDGACTGNPGPAGAGTVLIEGERCLELSTWLGEGTNNIAELTAILQGLERLTLPLRAPLVIHTDSQYCMGVLAQGWKARANKELVAEIRSRAEPLQPIVWHWVRGHEGVALNERCDELAREAISRRAHSERQGTECG